MGGGVRTLYMYIYCQPPAGGRIRSKAGRSALVDVPSYLDVGTLSFVQAPSGKHLRTCMLLDVRPMLVAMFGEGFWIGSTECRRIHGQLQAEA